MKNNPSQINLSEKGFSLIEVMITLGILVAMVSSISILMRTSIDLKLSLSQKSKVTNRLASAMQTIASDISHAFIIDTKNTVRSDNSRRTAFKIEKGLKSDKLMMTYMNHKQVGTDAKESDISYVVYEVKSSENKKFSSRTHLYRGEYPRPPDSARKVDDPKMEIFAEQIKSLTIEPWNGEDWHKDQWDSTSRDTNNFLPHMVKITLKGWAEEPIEGETGVDEDDKNLTEISTVVYLPMALDFNELKARNSSFNLKATE